MIDLTDTLDPAVDAALQALRELECDNDETTNSMEYNIRYIINGILSEIYISELDGYIALGVLETAKLEFFNSRYKD